MCFICFCYTAVTFSDVFSVAVRCCWWTRLRCLLSSCLWHSSSVEQRSHRERVALHSLNTATRQCSELNTHYRPSAVLYRYTTLFHGTCDNVSCFNVLQLKLMQSVHASDCEYVWMCGHIILWVSGSVWSDWGEWVITKCVTKMTHMWVGGWLMEKK